MDILLLASTVFPWKANTRPLVDMATLKSPQLWYSCLQWEGRKANISCTIYEQTSSSSSSSSLSSSSSIIFSIYTIYHHKKNTCPKSFMYLHGFPACFFSPTSYNTPRKSWVLKRATNSPEAALTTSTTSPTETHRETQGTWNGRGINHLPPPNRWNIRVYFEFTLPETSRQRTWTWMVGIRSFPFGVFQGPTVSSRECITLNCFDNLHLPSRHKDMERVQWLSDRSWKNKKTSHNLGTVRFKLLFSPVQALWKWNTHLEV